MPLINGRVDFSGFTDFGTSRNNFLRFRSVNLCASFEFGAEPRHSLVRITLHELDPLLMTLLYDVEGKIPTLRFPIESKLVRGLAYENKIK